MPSFRPLFDRKHLRQFLLTLKQRDVADMNMGEFIPEWQLPLSIQRVVKILVTRPDVSSILSEADLFEKVFHINPSMNTTQGGMKSKLQSLPMMCGLSGLNW